jgi:hypothetical protein
MVERHLVVVVRDREGVVHGLASEKWRVPNEL